MTVLTRGAVLTFRLVVRNAGAALAGQAQPQVTGG
jgi:hypothetical protein